MVKFWTLALAAVLLAAGSFDAEAARRMGGGGSVGKQSSNVTQRESGQAPAQAAPAQRQAQPGTPAAQTPPRRGFGGMLAGLAAGLGLAWLASALGFGEGFATILMIALLAVVAMAVIGAFMRRRAAQPGNLAWQGAAPAPDVAPAARQYNPEKIGNDASARPWERNSMAFDTNKAAGGGNLGIGSALQGSQAWGVPAGFDTEGFLAASKRNFVTLQDAWDRGDVPSLKAMMTDDMLAEIRSQLADRETHPSTGSGQPDLGRTEVEMLEAKLLGIEDLGSEYMASVEFSGMIREDASAGPQPFREVWNMTKAKDGASGWLVAGVQALQ